MKIILNYFFQNLFFILLSLLIGLSGCTKETKQQEQQSKSKIEATFHLTQDQTHNKFSRLIPPVIKVPSGAVIEAFTKEASDKQISINTTTEELRKMEFNRDLVHPLTGPVYVEGAQPGDVLEVTLHTIEIGDWGWTKVGDAGILGDAFNDPILRTWNLRKNKKSVLFSKNITVPLEPFAGVMGVAPDTGEMLSTIPPRANGGNMDDPNIVEGAKVYFPVFVEGALFSIGDGHAAQGHGEVCGTAIEIPMRIIYEVNVIKGKRYIKEPQYETDEFYAVTAFGITLDKAAKKATQYMVDYLVSEHNLNQHEAYMLCSLSGDLKIAEVVDINMLVAMHISKETLGIK